MVKPVYLPLDSIASDDEKTADTAQPIAVNQFLPLDEAVEPATEQRSFLGASAVSGGRTLLAAGAKLLEELNPFTTSEEDAAVLYKNDPEGFNRFVEKSAGAVLSRFAREQTRLSREVMEEVSPTETGFVSGKPLSELEYATLDPEKAAYLSPTRVAGDVLQSLPTTLALAVSAFITRGRSSAVQQEAIEQGLAKGLTREQAEAQAQKAAVAEGAKTMAIVGGTSEGLITAAQTANQVLDELAQLDPSLFEKSPEYKKLVDEGFSPETARAKIANDIADQAAAQAGVQTGLLSSLGGAYLGRVIGQGGGLASRVGRGAAAEALVEAPQSFGEQVAENIAMRRLRPEIGVFEGAGEAAAAGFVVGGVTGGGVTGLFGARSRQRTEKALEDLKNATDVDQVIESANELADAVDPRESLQELIAARQAYLAQSQQEQGLDSAAQAVAAQFGPTALEQAAQEATQAAETLSADERVAQLARGIQDAELARRGVEPRPVAEMTADQAIAEQARILQEQELAARREQRQIPTPTPARAQELEAVQAPITREVREGETPVTVEQAPMELLAARQRLAVLRDEAVQAGQDPANLFIAPAPRVPNRFIIQATPGFEYAPEVQGLARETQELPIVEPLEAFVNTMRRTNTPAAQRFVRDYDNGVITDADVQTALEIEQRGQQTAQQRLEDAVAQGAAEPEQQADIEIVQARERIESPVLREAVALYGDLLVTEQDIAELGAGRLERAAAQPIRATEGGLLVIEEGLTPRAEFEGRQEAIEQVAEPFIAERLETAEQAGITREEADARLAAAAANRDLSQPVPGAIILTDAKLSTDRVPNVGQKMSIADAGMSHEVTVVPSSEKGIEGAFLDNFLRVFGKRAVFFKSDTLKADGFVTQANTQEVFINSASQINPLAVAWHEVTHHMKRDNPTAYRAMASVVARNLDSASRAKFRQYYGQGASVEELSADLVGNFMMNPNFINEVFTEIQSLEPTNARPIITRLAAAWRKALNSFLQIARQTGFASEVFVKNVGDVRQAIKTALVDYARQQRLPAMRLEADIRQAGADIDFVAPQGEISAIFTAERARDEGIPAPAEVDRRITDADRSGPLPDYGRAREGAISVTGRHYSTGARQTLSGSFYGRGMAGAEAERIARATDPRLKSRVYFYVDDGRGITPEDGVGGIAHEVQLNNIYDPASRLVPVKNDANSFESAVLNAGFDGYIAPFGNQRAVVLLGPKHTAVPVVQVQPQAVERTETATPTEVAKALLSKELRDLNIEAIPGARIENGTLIVPTQEIAAANAELERIASPAKFSPARRGGRLDTAGQYQVRAQKDGSMAVIGDPDQIRTQLPPDIVGRVVQGGMLFTPSAAPRVRAALEGREVAYGRAGEVVEKLPMKDGKYIGAPGKFNTPGKIPTLRKWLNKLVDEGTPGRYWYENSSREVLKLVQGNVQEAKKFVALLSIYSPQAKVDANSTFALRAWAQYKAGQPISTKTRSQDEKARAALEDVDAFWSGEKTGNFFFNLLREIDPSTAGRQGATIDLWMMRAAEYPSDSPTATQYAFMENEINRIARDLGWEPQQVQAAIWVAMKARAENQGVKRRTEESSEKNGWIRYEYPIKNGKRVKTRVIVDAQKHRDNWLKNAIAHKPSAQDTAVAKFDFGDGLRRHIGQLSWEARPGRTTGVLPGVNDASYEQQVEFQQAIQNALLDENGVDLLAYKLGLLVDGPDILAPGVWQGEIAAGMQKLLTLAPAKAELGKTQIDEAQKQALDAYASVLGLLLRQESVGYHRPFYSSTKAKANGVNLDAGRTFTPAEAQALWAAIDQRMQQEGVVNWERNAGLISSPTGMRVVNFGAMADNAKFRAAVEDAAASLMFDSLEVGHFASDGDLISNDWKENPNGEDYKSRITATGSPDLLEWAGNVLAPRVQSVFNEFSSRYGWGDPGRVPLLEAAPAVAAPAAAPAPQIAQAGAVALPTPASLVPPSLDLRRRQLAEREVAPESRAQLSRQRSSPFYSQLAKAIDEVPARLETQPAPQWKAWLASNSAKLGIKKEEIEWTGINDYLDLRGKDKVTKDEIGEYLKANGVQVEEVQLQDLSGKYIVYEDGVPVPGEIFDTEAQADKWIEDQIEANLEGDYSNEAEVDEQQSRYESGLIDEADIEAEDGGTQYKTYQLPGGKNYKELLLTLPTQDARVSAIVEQARLTDDEAARYRDLESLLRRGEANSAEIAELERLEKRKEESQQAYAKARVADGRQDYISRHWNQRNVLAHIRFNERTDADGKRVLFIEEMQSDWAQEGRKKNFTKKPITREDVDLVEGQRTWADGLVSKWVDVVIRETGTRIGRYDPESSDNPDAYVRDAINTENAGRKGVPLAPFVQDTKAWVALATKRMIAYAVDNGFDKVAFVNGQQSADRYDLSKQISKVQWDEDTARLTAWDKNATERRPDGRTVIDESNVTADRLEDYVGKEVAQKLISQEADEDGVRELSGLDLKVGGKGMVAFYDKIVPQVVNDVLKKVGGGKLEAVAFEPEQIASREDRQAYAAGTKEIPDVVDQPGFNITEPMKEKAQQGLPLFSRQRNIFGDPAPQATWGMPDSSKITDLVFKLQDRMVDTGAAVKAIEAARGKIDDTWNPYLKEELYHGRTAKGVKDFIANELEPLVKEMQARGVDIQEFENYLHNRHAEERNNQIAKINPNMPDGGSGIDTAKARRYLASLSQAKKADFEALAKRIDQITRGTRKILIDSGLESSETLQAWEQAYENYVPLMREEADYDPISFGAGTGQGYSVRGSASRRAVGSDRRVVDILANIAMQRERTIVRSEKLRVAKAVYGMAAANPNPDFWFVVNPDAVQDPNAAIAELVKIGLNPLDAENFIKTPKEKFVDPKTGLVTERVNPRVYSQNNVLAVRVDGQDRFVFFNTQNERAMRMVSALKNLDGQQVGEYMGMIGKVTRYFASVNTQYNPIFGVINFTRDVQGALLNLSNTPLANDYQKVLADTRPALAGIYSDLRKRRAGQPAPANQWSQLWGEFQRVGGQTGYRDLFTRSQERTEAIQRMLDPAGWANSPLGKVFTANGNLKVPLEVARKTAKPLFDWLSDYNETMENAVRLAAYKTAIDKGMSKDKAASLAKNLTVNFNRKGQIGNQVGALYAFYNASVQGITRMYETIKGPAGKKIMYGGLLLGSAQALMLAALGFDEDEPPQFIRERNLIIPISKDNYVSIPMPLGYNVIPNTGRVLTEWMLSGFKDTPQRLVSIAESFLDMFNPIGNAGWSYQTAAPTVADPLVALFENRDWTGKPIAKEDMSGLNPTPGYTRAKDTASIFSKELSYYLNLASGGTRYKPGFFSPTPDQIDYLIGQLTGGVGRETLKAEQTITSLVTGEELPVYKIPLVGRFVGQTTGQAAEGGRFYENIKRLNAHELEIKGRQKEGRGVSEYLRENPEARLFQLGNQAEREVRLLRQRKREMIEREASKESIKMIDARITQRMKELNDRMREVNR